MQFSGTGARVGKEEGKSVYVLYIWGGKVRGGRDARSNLSLLSVDSLMQMLLFIYFLFWFFRRLCCCCCSATGSSLRPSAYFRVQSYTETETYYSGRTLSVPSVCPYVLCLFIKK